MLQGAEAAREMGLASGGGVAGAGVISPPLGADPTVVAGGVLAVVAAAGILLFVQFRSNRTRAHRFRAALSARNEVAVLTHPNPDPDALACALTVRELAEDVGTDATIYYPGEIRHEENLALVRELEIEATRLRDRATCPAVTWCWSITTSPEGSPVQEGSPPTPLSIIIPATAREWRSRTYVRRTVPARAC
jgi:Exopolyphosphatase-related proteins